MSRLAISSPVGELTIVTTSAGVSRLWWNDASDGVGDDTLLAQQHLEQTCAELTEYFAGNRKTFDVGIDRSTRRGFRGEVLGELENVPYGEVVSYGELAARAGRPKAARSVGTAMATNPVAIIVPCHRVVRSTGGVGSFGGGLEAKKWLLALEDKQPLS